MNTPISILVAQLNPVLGDIQGNLRQALEVITGEAATDVDLIVFPELFLLGYPPEDLVRKPAVLDACETAIQTLCEKSREIRATIVIGAPKGVTTGVANSAFVLRDGEIVCSYDKHELPDYGVFDEFAGV